ncbi:MAG: phosphate ABC transporter permease subunit PstC [Myxococcaceae bacterium]|nr:MAG: phosphate ABC transporter permease subunit PstC [Myxococcaceae bacterium]
MTTPTPPTPSEEGFRTAARSDFPPRLARPLVRGEAGGRRVTPDAVFRRVCLSAALAILGLLALLLGQMGYGARLSLGRFGLGFLVARVWDPVAEHFGAATFVYGTVVSSLLALALAVPFGVAIAIFLVEVAPRWLRGPVGFLVELLAAVPSIVYGLWGLFVLAPVVREVVAPALHATLGFLPAFRGTSHGVGMLTAGMLLAVMILPFIAAITRDVLTAVPREQREASLALGATRWETIWHVVLPYGRAGIIGGVILALGRALGETMAVTMVIGNNPQIAASLFAPGYTMSAVIANEYAEASGPLYLAALTEIGLLLFVVTFTVNALARTLIWRMARSSSGSPS